MGKAEINRDHGGTNESPIKSLEELREKLHTDFVGKRIDAIEVLRIGNDKVLAIVVDGKAMLTGTVGVADSRRLGGYVKL